MAWKLRHTPDKSISKLLKLSSVGWESHLVSFPTPFYSLLCISHKNTSTHTHTQWHGRNIQNRLAPYSQLHGLWVLLSRHRGGRHLIHSCIKCWDIWMCRWSEVSSAFSEANHPVLSKTCLDGSLKRNNQREVTDVTVTSRVRLCRWTGFKRVTGYTYVNLVQCTHSPPGFLL